jgi:GcrA cell cycle regulator
MTTWTNERTEQLKSHFDAGFSCAEIARRIGATRNAVIGKLNRLGLSRPKNVLARVPEAGAAARFRRPRLVAALRADPYAAIDEAPPASAERCSLLDLTAAKCRWPLGDPSSDTFRFCGNKQLAGFPYCATHARMAYRRTARA